MNDKKRMFLIKLPYWLGIGADALWVVALFFPQVFAILTGTPTFNPDSQTILFMRIGGILMTGWTVLLLWAVRKPIERRGVILITAFPVVFGLFIVTLNEFIKGSSTSIWILIKTSLLFISMLTSYILAGKKAN